MTSSTDNRRSHLERLPPELYIELLDSMDPKDGILLSLTCRKLWSMASPKSRSLLSDLKRRQCLSNRIEFLNLLERDDPKYIRCSVCMKLHVRLDNEIGLLALTYRIKRPCANTSGIMELGSECPGGGSCPMTLPREAVELVLRSFDQGPGYGIPVSRLRASAVRKAYKVTMVSTTFNCEGRVHVPKRSPLTSVGGEPRLMMRTKYQMEVDLEQSIRAQVEGAELMGCGHQKSLEQDAITNTVNNVMGDIPQTIHLTTLHKCRYCPTDMEITVRRMPEEYLASVAVEAWRDLGGRGYHARGEWKHQTSGPYLSQMTPFDRSLGYALGTRPLKEVFAVAQCDEVEAEGCQLGT